MIIIMLIIMKKKYKNDINNYNIFKNKNFINKTINKLKLIKLIFCSKYKKFSILKNKQYK